MSVRHLVLGLLKRAPMHGYEIQRVMKEARVDLWAGALPGSLYHALRKMEGEGLVRIKALEQSGLRQRAVYEITKDGEAELRSFLLSCWEEPIRPFPVPFYLGMTFLDDPDAALPAIERRIVSLRAEMEEWEQGVVAKKEAPGPARLAMENFAQHLQLDLDMLVRLRDLLSD
ncbi:PadR family transcriptional regulator [Sphingosinicella rhizophila]|uniref:PadR family transcriptional regulator n=1 Tax=Sphingosinicella rhizophila TaxID=3050082 RepID=A0ABU3QBI9_9SPHN|nr:PadR family transcriptional regulator [Sphingosinicella sp. GR2756]MDT9600687.1 PadR family transcriptional regulator [Sphingosinicella sp. GR2756]